MAVIAAEFIAIIAAMRPIIRRAINQLGIAYTTSPKTCDGYEAC
jgi:hypothetical protein